MTRKLSAKSTAIKVVAGIIKQHQSTTEITVDASSYSKPQANAIANKVISSLKEVLGKDAEKYTFTIKIDGSDKNAHSDAGMVFKTGGEHNNTQNIPKDKRPKK